VSFTLDKTPPSIGLTRDTGVSATDKITSIPAVWGKNGQPGTAVTIKESGATLGTTMTDSNGHWSFLAHVNAGPHTLVASQTDLAGNTGSASLTFTLDTQYVWGALSST
jgi:hypothetical protein